MGYNYQDAPRESQQEYFGRVHTDNKETLQNALKRIEELEGQVTRAFGVLEGKRKRIEELEQENALLKGRNEGFEQQIMGLLIKYEEVYKRFPDLKSAMDKAQTILKENAELKEHIKADCIDCVDYIKNQKLEKQIEKMKCCMNCRHSEEDNKSSTICDECFELCYWEMKE